MDDNLYLELIVKFKRCDICVLIAKDLWFKIANFYIFIVPHIRSRKKKKNILLYFLNLKKEAIHIYFLVVTYPNIFALILNPTFFMWLKKDSRHYMLSK